MLDLNASTPNPTFGLDVTTANSMLDLDASPPNLMLGLDATATNSKLGVDASSPNHKLDLNASTTTPMLDLDASSANPMYNILKRLSASLTIYLDLKHCELEQCNGSPALAIKSCKGSGEEVGLSFSLGLHLALNGWLGRKWSLQVLVGLPRVSAKPAPPCEDTWRIG
jgi:hypothetical protein